MMNNRQRIEALESQVFNLVNMIFAMSEIIEDKNLATKAAIAARAKKVAESRTQGISYSDREKNRKVLDRIILPGPNGFPRSLKP